MTSLTSWAHCLYLCKDTYTRTYIGSDESNYQFKCSMQWLILNLEVILPKTVYYHHCIHKKTTEFWTKIVNKKRSWKCFYLATCLYEFEYWILNSNCFLFPWHVLTPHSPHGDLLPKGNLCRLSVLNVNHHVALKHGFAWLCLAVCKPSFSLCAFWLTWAPQCLACSDCACCYKPVIQMVSTFH